MGWGSHGRAPDVCEEYREEELEQGLGKLNRKSSGEWKRCSEDSGLRWGRAKTNWYNDK
jgi:hypothetical protein